MFLPWLLSVMEFDLEMEDELNTFLPKLAVVMFKRAVTRKSTACVYSRTGYDGEKTKTKLNNN